MLQFTCGLNSETLRLFHLQGYKVYSNLNHDHTEVDLALYSPYSEPHWYCLRYFQVALVQTKLCDTDFIRSNWNYNANANMKHYTLPFRDFKKTLVYIDYKWIWKLQYVIKAEIHEHLLIMLWMKSKICLYRLNEGKTQSE